MSFLNGEAYFKPTSWKLKLTKQALRRSPWEIGICYSIGIWWCWADRAIVNILLAWDTGSVVDKTVIQFLVVDAYELRWIELVWLCLLIKVISLKVHIFCSVPHFTSLPCVIHEFKLRWQWYEGGNNITHLFLGAFRPTCASQHLRLMRAGDWRCRDTHLKISDRCEVAGLSNFVPQPSFVQTRPLWHYKCKECWLFDVDTLLSIF